MGNFLFTVPTNNAMIIVWLCICVGCLVIEGMATELVSIYFSIAALICMILSIIGVSFWPQLWIYAFIVGLTLFTTRPLFLKYLKKNEIKTNSDALYGQRFKLTKAITVDERGELVISGVTWNVITSDSSAIEVNTMVEIVAIEGSKLIVKEIL
ncbi:MAG: NfeD family protein [bacterium]